MVKGPDILVCLGKKGERRARSLAGRSVLISDKARNN